MFFFDPTFLILIPGIIITIIAQNMVQKAYSQYSQVGTKNNLTGAQAARLIMANNQLNDVNIRAISGTMSDNYNPRDKVMSLSNPVMNGATIASVGIAAHETGHALQHQQGYWPIKVRNFIVPLCSFASGAAWPLFFIGLIFSRSSEFGYYLMDAGIILFSIALLFYLITLPVEFDASRRAVKAIRDQNLLEDDEIQGVKRVLTAAALTYVASMLMSLLNLVRLMAIRGRR